MFQLLSALVEAHPAAALPDFYKHLIPPILKVDLWQAKGNVPALVRLLSALINRAGVEFVSSNQIEPVLGIFERLCSTRQNEAQAFELLECILTSLPPYESQTNDIWRFAS